MRLRRPKNPDKTISGLAPVKSGFTLIELLVVMTIIAVLSAAGVVAYETVLKNNRDQNRLTELDGIRQSLEAFRNDQGYYPSAVTFNSSLTSPDGLKTYLSKIPNDPIYPDQNYIYQAQQCDSSTPPRCLGFIICAKRENSSRAYPDPSGCSSLVCASQNGQNINCDMGVSSY